MYSLYTGCTIYHNTGENYYDVYVYTKFLSLSGKCTLLLSKVSIGIVYLPVFKISLKEAHLLKLFFYSFSVIFSSH